VKKCIDYDVDVVKTQQTKENSWRQLQGPRKHKNFGIEQKTWQCWL